MHQALYRKWRPQTFDEVCGQEHITSILKYETEHGKFSHAYLFCGSRGTGKTTCAKILAKAVNCESPVNGSPCNRCASCMAIDGGSATDVLEMDAASNNGVDNIRDIRDEVVYTPSALKYRVYIVDEVHMLSGSAFNALLKTLEEPPAHVVFILATTELHKLPSTIISRCQRFDFRRIATQVLCDRLAHISDSEGIEYDTDALRILAKLAQGGMRDAISLLELCAGTRKKITATLVDETVGSGGRENVERTVRAISVSNFDAIFSAIDTVVRSSRDLAVYWQELISFYRDMLVMKTTAAADRYLDLTEVESERLKKTADLFSKETLLYHCRILDDALQNMQCAGAAKRMVAEMALIKMCDTSLDTSTDALLSRISKLENAIASGVAFQPNRLAEQPVDREFERTEKTAEPVSDQDTINGIDPSESPQKEIPCTLKILRGWNEMAEKAAAGDGAALGFLKLAKAFRDSEGRVYVKFPNDFARSMLDRPQIRDNIRAAISLSTQQSLEDRDLIFDLLKENENISDLDDLELES
ncbi:MAG: DNA polymerase III subunit gamma/tau [Clostridia bacterium]|nr:DNA polymerase III subunit gamma/tau [Clostridia bacterium]